MSASEAKSEATNNGVPANTTALPAEIGADRYRALVEGSHMLMWVNDAAGRTIFTNRPWRQFTGVSLPARPGWDDLIHPDDHEVVRQTREHRLASGEPYMIECRLRRADGEYRWHLAQTAPVRDAGGVVIEWIGTAVDEHERKKAAETLRAGRDRAEAASRARDRFFTALSRELRTPLTPVLMTATALEARTDVPEDIRRDVALIRQHVEQEAKLIDDLLDLTQVSRGQIDLQKRPTDLHAALQESLKACGSEEMERKGLKVTLDLSARRFVVMADPGRLRQMLTSLLGNAFKFTPERGEITIATFNEPGLTPEGQVLVDITDTGIGIEASALPNIFTAYEEADPAILKQFGGLGLGLAIAHALAQLHGGMLEARSEGKHQGSTFTLALPVTRRQMLVEDEATPMADDFPVRPLSILLVEDHQATSDVLSRLLTEQGHHVHVAHSVHAALAVTATTKLDLVISDIGLPDAPGTALAARLRQYNLPAIAVSGLGGDQDITAALNAGFSAHLTKPISFPALQTAMNQALTLQ